MPVVKFTHKNPNCECGCRTIKKLPRKCGYCDKTMKSNSDPDSKVHMKCWKLMTKEDYFEDWFNAKCDPKGKY